MFTTVLHPFKGLDYYRTTAHLYIGVCGNAVVNIQYPHDRNMCKFAVICGNALNNNNRISAESEWQRR